MSTQSNKAYKAEHSAEQDLEEADAWANKRGIYGAKQKARAMRREAKRRRAKARRRQAQRICDQYDEFEEEFLEQYEN